MEEAMTLSHLTFVLALSLGQVPECPPVPDRVASVLQEYFSAVKDRNRPRPWEQLRALVFSPDFEGTLPCSTRTFFRSHVGRVVGAMCYDTEVKELLDYVQDMAYYREFNRRLGGVYGLDERCRDVCETEVFLDVSVPMKPCSAAFDSVRRSPTTFAPGLALAGIWAFGESCRLCDTAALRFRDTATSFVALFHAMKRMKDSPDRAAGFNDKTKSVKLALVITDGIWSEHASDGGVDLASDRTLDSIVAALDDVRSFFERAGELLVVLPVFVRSTEDVRRIADYQRRLWRRLGRGLDAAAFRIGSACSADSLRTTLAGQVGVLFRNRTRVLGMTTDQDSIMIDVLAPPCAAFQCGPIGPFSVKCIGNLHRLTGIWSAVRRGAARRERYTLAGAGNGVPISLAIALGYDRCGLRACTDALGSDAVVLTSGAGYDAAAAVMWSSPGVDGQSFPLPRAADSAVGGRLVSSTFAIPGPNLSLGQLGLAHFQTATAKMSARGDTLAVGVGISDRLVPDTASGFAWWIAFGCLVLFSAYLWARLQFRGKTTEEYRRLQKRLEPFATLMWGLALFGWLTVIVGGLPRPPNHWFLIIVLVATAVFYPTVLMGRTAEEERSFGRVNRLRLPWWRVVARVLLSLSAVFPPVFCLLVNADLFLARRVVSVSRFWNLLVPLLALGVLVLNTIMNERGARKTGDERI
jgi:hypothetical protein